MTQAFNLAQLANNLNTSGQLDATDGLSGLVANTNLASTGTADSTTFLRGDRTWAQAGLFAATTAQAQAGTSDTVAITPLKMREGFNASGSAPVYACRAWVQFNGITMSVAGNGNVSSVAQNGTGDYTVNFSTALPDANGAFYARQYEQQGRDAVFVSVSASAVRFQNQVTTMASLQNSALYMFAVFR